MFLGGLELILNSVWTGLWHDEDVKEKSESVNGPEAMVRLDSVVLQVTEDIVCSSRRDHAARGGVQAPVGSESKSTWAEIEKPSV
jgi:hypothetical protein